MRIGIEENRPAEFLVSSLTDLAGFDVTRLPRAAALASVRSGQLDLALVPPLTILRDWENLAVVPAVALSSWGYPFAQLYLPDGLDTPPPSILYDHRYREEADLARIVLKEHYGVVSQFKASDEAIDTDVAAMHVGDLTRQGRPRGIYLDLGQEWSELANYPMVSGLFVMEQGSVTPDIVRELRVMAAKAETLRKQWASMDGGTFRRFFLEDVRVRFDDLVTASLTQLSDFAFYYDLIDEIRAFPVASVDLTSVDDDRTPLL